MGFEINPYAAFAVRTKLAAHRLEPDGLRASVAAEFEAFMAESARIGRTPEASPPAAFRTRAPFYSPAVERKVLLAFDFMAGQEARVRDLFRLAFAATMVGYSNYSYEPSLGRKASVGRVGRRGRRRGRRHRGPAAPRWPNDASLVPRRARSTLSGDDGQVRRANPSWKAMPTLEEGSVDLLVTSPPYLNNYHYNRNTRPHLYWLGFCSAPGDLKRLEKLNVGTYWQNARDQEFIDLDPAIDDNGNPPRDARSGARAEPGKAHLRRQRLGQLRGALLQRLRALPRRRGPLPAAGRDRAGGHRQLHPAGGGDPDRPLPRPHRGVTRGFEVAGIHVPRETRVGSSIVESSVRAGKAGGSALYESVVELRRR